MINWKKTVSLFFVFSVILLFSDCTRTRLLSDASQPLGALYYTLPSVLKKFSTVGNSPYTVSISPFAGEEKFALNKRIVIAFSEPVKALSPNPLRLFKGNTEIEGNYKINGNALVFTPSTFLTKNSNYTVSISKDSLSSAKNIVFENDFKYQFSTGDFSDSVPPLIVYASPLDAASGVSVSTGLSILFSEPIDPASVTSDTAQIRLNGQPVSAELSLIGSTLQIRPKEELLPQTSYSVYLDSGISDMAGIVMGAVKTSFFTTDSGKDVLPPSLSTILPVDSASDVSANTKAVVTVFSEDLNSSTVNRDSLAVKDSGGNRIDGYYANYGNTVLFYPYKKWDTNKKYNIQMTNSIQDLSGNSFAGFSSSFTTVSSAVPISTFSPSSPISNIANGASWVSVSTVIQLYYPEAIDPATVNVNTISMVDIIGNKVNGTFQLLNGGRTVSFTPTVLGSFMNYTVTVNTSLKAISGNMLSATYSLNFTTGALPTLSIVTRPWGTFTDLGNGTIRFDGVAGTFGGNSYTAKTLIYMKCSQGQVWDSVSNNCAGTGTGANNFGLGFYQFCTTNTDDCNGGSISYELGMGSPAFRNGAASTAYNTCSSIGVFGGRAGWRVTTKNELKLLVLCSDPTELPTDGYGAICLSGNEIPATVSVFPNSLNTMYWSSTATWFGSAWYINFNDGSTEGTNRTGSLPVRCVTP